MSTDEQTTDPTDLTEQPEVTEQPDQTEQPDKAGKEAAKYRRRLREAETERDSAREQMDALRRQVAESASGLDKPAALWAAGVSLDDLFTDQGTLDHDAITAAVETVREMREMLRMAAGDDLRADVPDLEDRAAAGLRARHRARAAVAPHQPLRRQRRQGAVHRHAGSAEQRGDN